MKKMVLYLCLVSMFSLFSACAKTYSTEPVNKHEKSELYNQAINCIEEKRYPQAMSILVKLNDHKNSKDLLKQIRYLIEGSYISNGTWAVGAIITDGRIQVVYEGKDVNRFAGTESWKNVKSLSFRGGDSIEGLTTSFQTFYPQSAVAVTNDGSVYGCYPFYEDGTVKLEGWDNIVSVADGRGYVVGLKEDGTVKCNVYAYSGTIDTSEWKDIVAVSAGTSVIGLKEDGTVVSTGLNRYGEGNVSSWTDIIAISTCGACTLGLKSDGTVVAAGQNIYGQMDVTNWTNIVAIAAGEYFSIGLKSDGSMVLSGDCSNSGVKTPDVFNMRRLYVPEISANN